LRGRVSGLGKFERCLEDYTSGPEIEEGLQTLKAWSYQKRGPFVEKSCFPVARKNVEGTH